MKEPPKYVPATLEAFLSDNETANKNNNSNKV